MYILADIGGTKMRIAASVDVEKFNEPTILDTPQSYTDGLALLINVAREKAQGQKINGVAIGIACALSRDKRRTFNTRNLADWNERDLATALEAELNAPVFLENDAATVGLGEYSYGAGRGVPIMVYMTVSTGVNGVRIVNGTIDSSAYGFEIGGQYIPDGGEVKTLEEMISGRAIEEKYGTHPRDLGKDSSVWEELARYLAYGLNNTILHWSPDRVVLGGSMFNDIGIPLDRVREHLQHMKKKIAGMPEITHADLESLGGLYGAMALLKQREA